MVDGIGNLYFCTIKLLRKIQYIIYKITNIVAAGLIMPEAFWVFTCDLFCIGIFFSHVISLAICYLNTHWLNIFGLAKFVYKYVLHVISKD